MSFYTLEGTLTTENWWIEVRQSLLTPDDFDAMRALYMAMWVGPYELLGDSISIAREMNPSAWTRWDQQVVLRPRTGLAHYRTEAFPGRGCAAGCAASGLTISEPKPSHNFANPTAYFRGRFVGYLDCIEYDRQDPDLLASPRLALDAVVTGPRLGQIEITPAIGPAA